MKGASAVRADHAVVGGEDHYQLLFENALDAILILDDDDVCLEANPATSQLLGRTHAELIGQSLPALILDGEPRFDGEWRALVARRVRTKAARGYVRLRHADGTVREVEYSAVANIGPGTHLAILRDATERRETERLTLRRQAVLDALGTLPTDASAPDLAQAACRAMVEHSGFPEVALFLAEPPDRIVLLGAALGDESAGVVLPQVVDGVRGAAILDRSEAGEWVIDWTDPEGRPNETVIAGLPILAVAWAPIKADGRLVGLLAVRGSLVAAELRRSLPYVVDLAKIVAGSTLGRSLREQSSIRVSRQRIQRIVSDAAFRPVFQPIVDLESGETLAYEALTRFDDGTSPEVVFAEAARAGLSTTLEIAVARAGLEAAAPLPANRSIHLNVSPELILGVEPLRGMLRDWGFGVTLEVTEHSPIADYAAVRAAVAELGAGVRIAIDDAGAGFASLRHILELRPAVVKLDMSLIRGVDADPARQALVAGLVHFAARLEFVLVAEGIETTAEQATLLALGVRRAQGYLFGRPAAAGEFGSKSTQPWLAARSRPPFIARYRACSGTCPRTSRRQRPTVRSAPTVQRGRERRPASRYRFRLTPHRSVPGADLSLESSSRDGIGIVRSRSGRPNDIRGRWFTPSPDQSTLGTGRSIPSALAPARRRGSG